MAHVKTTGLKIAALFLLLVCLGPFQDRPAWGQQEKSPAKKDNVPLHITAARLEADQDKRLVIFSGQVKAQQGDAVLYADQLLVYYQPGPETAARAGPAPQPEKATSPLADLGGEKIDRIEAQGNVRFVQEDKVATGDKAVFYQERDEVVLLGRPQVWRGENTIRGERIVFHLKDKRVTVEGSSAQRVEAHLYQAQTSPSGGPGLLPGTRKDPERRPRSRRP